MVVRQPALEGLFHGGLAGRTLRRPGGSRRLGLLLGRLAVLRGGAVGAALMAQQAKAPGAVCLDMGGTSCDVCVVEDGAVRRTDSRMIGGRPIQLPMVDVHTVGAGGGSIGWVDHGGALRVGPRSAGAAPGPACYGRGGTEPTVTDANLALGYLEPGSTLAGGVALDPAAAGSTLSRLGAELGLAALVHAAALADELGITRILCPRAGGVLSALGLIASERRRDTARTVMLRGPGLTSERIAAEQAALRAAIGAGLEDAETEAEYDLRYHGQAFELSVRGTATPDPRELVEAFEAEHERRYGYRGEAAEVELVNVRLALRVAGPTVEPVAAPPGAIERSRRRARFGADWLEAEVLRGEPPDGLEAEGPCVFELPEATLVLPPGWRATVDRHGTIAAARLP